MKKSWFITLGFLLILIAGIGAPLPSQAQEPPSPLNLEQCVAIALVRNPSLRAAGYAVRAEQARVRQAEAPYYPQLSATTGYVRSESEGFTGTRRIANPYYAVSLTQQLYDFGKTGWTTTAARATHKASRHDLAQTRADVILNVQSTYFGLLASQRIVFVREQTLEQALAHLQQAQAFFEVGTKPRFDVTQAEVVVNNARLDLVIARNNVRLSRITLNNAMGLDPTAFTRIVDIPVSERTAPSLEESQQEAGVGRPESQAMKARILAAEAGLRAARADYFPTVAADATYRRNEGEEDTQRFGKAPLGSNWTAQVTLSLPLFEGFLTQGKVAEARANLEKLQAEQEALRQAILLEVNQAHAEMEDAGARLTLTESNLKKARENLEIAQGRYEAGVGTLLEVTDAQVLLTKAETDAVQAQYDYLLAMAKLERAVGTQ